MLWVQKQIKLNGNNISYHGAKNFTNVSPFEMPCSKLDPTKLNTPSSSSVSNMSSSVSF